MILLLVACFSEAQFREESDAAVCAWKRDCFDHDYSACVDAAEEAVTELDAGCEYDAQNARACTDGLEQLPCPDDTEEDEEFGFPSACDAVWSCPPG